MRVLNKVFGPAAVMLLLLSGCASAPVVKERYFWPPPPDEPKIEWLGTYTNQLDLREKGAFSFLIGEEEPVGLSNPAAIAADGAGKVFVSDLRKKGVVVFDFNKREAYMLGGAAAIGLFTNPSGIAIDGEGNILVGDMGDKKIHVFDRNEKLVRSIDFSHSVKSISFFAIDKGRKRIIIPDVRGHKVVIADYGGTVIKTIENFDGKDGFNFPNCVAIDPIKGDFLVADSMNSRVIRFTADGEYISKFGKRGDAIGDISMIKAVAVDSEGHIYLTDVKANRIQIFNEKGEALLVIGKFSINPYEVGGFNSPTGIYIDQNDTIYITEKVNIRFQMYQYLNSKYLAQHPITSETVIAKPKKEEEKVDEATGGKKAPPSKGK